MQAARQRAGINSLEVGLRLAKVLAEDGLPLPLKDLAARAHMPPAKAHRYLVSLIRAGLAEQDREGSRYRLGPLAIELGLAALGALDVIKFGAEIIAELCAEVDETVLLAIWGNKGPVVARWEESSRPVATNVRAGWVMPLNLLPDYVEVKDGRVARGGHFDNAFRGSVADQTGNVVNIEFLHHLLAVFLDRLNAQPQLGGNLLVGEAFGN